MTTESKFDIAQLHLESITIVNAAINNNSGVQTPKTTDFDIKFNQQAGVNMKLKKIQVLFDCSFMQVKEENDTTDVSANFQIAYVFHIDNIEELITMKNDIAELEPALSASLANIVYSTSRGIIFTRCLGTVLGNVIMPIMATSKLLNPSELKK